MKKLTKDQITWLNKAITDFVAADPMDQKKRADIVHSAICVIFMDPDYIQGPIGVDIHLQNPIVDADVAQLQADRWKSLPEKERKMEDWVIEVRFK